MSVVDKLDFRETPGGARPYAFFLPRPTGADFLWDVARYAESAIPSGTRSLHLIAIANSGIPIASAILLRRYSQGLKDDVTVRDAMSIVDPDQLDYVAQVADIGSVTVLVDNSVKSVHTLSQVVPKL